MSIERTEKQIEEQIVKAINSIQENGTKWPGMTYEQGVRNALDWVMGDEDTPPMEDE